jgi:hypothetical protein
MRDRLVRDLLTQGADITAPNGNVLLIRAYGGESLEPPLTLSLSESQFDDLLESYGDGARAVFPSDGSRTAAYKLFLVHLDEIIATLRPGQTEIRLVEGHLRSFPEVASDPPPEPMPSARWAADKPDATAGQRDRPVAR